MSDDPIEVRVCDLVRMTARPVEEREWKLALVQRDEVWDEYRVAKLLDSLLRGYPIGTLVLIRPKVRAIVLEPDATTRRAVEDSHAWQILDGQQRIVAIANLFGVTFGVHRNQSRFFLHMSAEAPSDLRRGRRDDRIRDYITWVRPGSEYEADFSRPHGSHSLRSHWLDLARLGEALREGRWRFPSSPSVDSLATCDHEFGGVLPGGERTFDQRFESLRRTWEFVRIPLLKTEPETPDDVLEIFARLNAEGVRTSQAELFFAAVKTRWHNAEEVLDGIVGRVPLLSRLGALRLLARFTHLEGHGLDLLPLDANRLAGSGGTKLTKDMEAIARQESAWNAAAETDQWLREVSGIGAGLRYVDEQLLEHVFCWAMRHGVPSESDFRALAGYLVAATVFQLSAILRNSFSRAAMICAYDAAKQGLAFPVERILDKVVDLSKENGRPLRLPLDAKAIREEFVNRRPWQLFLSVAQDLPYDHEPCQLDWDHLYAQSLRHRMKWKPQGASRRQYHDDSRLIWRTGNICGLEARLNRAAQGERPTVKLRKLRLGEYGQPLWPANLFLSDSEESNLLAADNLLENGDTERAMQHFGEYVRSRELRLWNSLVERFPLMHLFTEKLEAH